ncbi:MAG: hypothetical protein ABII76_07225, partial [Pseudomonadota bacterium]
AAAKVRAARAATAREAAAVARLWAGDYSRLLEDLAQVLPLRRVAMPRGWKRRGEMARAGAEHTGDAFEALVRALDRHPAVEAARAAVIVPPHPWEAIKAEGDPRKIRMVEKAEREAAYAGCGGEPELTAEMEEYLSAVVVVEEARRQVAAAAADAKRRILGDAAEMFDEIYPVYRRWESGTGGIGAEAPWKSD